MRYSLSIASSTFAAAKVDFDRLLLATINKMLGQDITEGSVALKIDIKRNKQFPISEDEYAPCNGRVASRAYEFARRRAIFERVVNSCRWHEFSVRGRNKSARTFAWRCGVPELFDRDNATLFDLEDAQ